MDAQSDANASDALSDGATLFAQLEQHYQRRRANSGTFVDADVIDTAVSGSDVLVTVELGGEEVTFEKSVAHLTTPILGAMHDGEVRVRYAEDDFSQVEVQGDDGNPLPVVERTDRDCEGLADAGTRLAMDRGSGPIRAHFRSVDVEDDSFVAEVEVVGTVLTWHVGLNDGIPTDLQAIADTIGGGSIRGIEGQSAYITARHPNLYPATEPLATIDGPVVQWGLFAGTPSPVDFVGRMFRNHRVETCGVMMLGMLAPFAYIEHFLVSEVIIAPAMSGPILVACLICYLAQRLERHPTYVPVAADDDA